MSGASMDRSSLRFMGGVSAEISHEVTNVLTVMGELSGLLSDLAAADRAGRKPLSAEKVLRTAEKLSAQVERGKTIVRHFNRFAHSADTDQVLAPLGEMLDRFAVLARRIAQRRRTEITVVSSDATATMTLDAFALYRLLFDAFDLLSEGYETVEISCTPSKAGAEILFRGIDRRPDAVPMQTVSIDRTVSISGLDADVETTDDVVRIRLVQGAAGKE